MSTDLKGINFQQAIENKINKKKQNAEDAFVNICYVFMKELNLSYEEILDLPVPMAMRLLDKINKENKEIQKSLKKKK